MEASVARIFFLILIKFRYPELLVVPEKIDDKTLKETTKFRSRERIPSLSFAYKRLQTKSNFFLFFELILDGEKEFSTLWRSSQCRAGLQIIN